MGKESKEPATVPLWVQVDKDYLLEKGRYIKPDTVRPSSNVRRVRETGVKLLYDILREQGWSNEKGLRVKELSPGPDGKRYYGCIDGMHRITAIHRLQEEEEAELKKVDKDKRDPLRYWTRLEVLASVYSETLPRSVEIQLAVEANWATSVMVKTTMFDMLSAMAEIRRGLLGEHNAKVQEKIDQGAADTEENDDEDEEKAKKMVDDNGEEDEEEQVGGKKGRKKKKRGRKPKRVKSRKKRGGPTKKKLGSLSVGLLKTPSDIPRDWVSDAYYKGGRGSYAQSTVGTFSSLLYRFDGCPRSWAELERICNTPETEMAVNNSNLYTTEFSSELSDGVKYWILRRLCGEFKNNGKGLSKIKSRKVMAKQICVVREVEKLASIFKTSLLDFQWGNAELEEILREGLENGAFDKEIPQSPSERQKLNNNPGTLLSSFDILVENYHEAGRDALEGFHREKLAQVHQDEDEDEEDEDEEEEEEGQVEGAEKDGEGKEHQGEEEQGGEWCRKRRLSRSEETTQEKKLKKRRRDKEVPKWISRGGTLRLFGQSFEEFLDSKEFEKIKGKARLVLTDPPYNVLKGVDHDRITEAQMQKFANGAFDILCRGGCLLVFCTWQQLAPWYKILKDAGFLVCSIPMHIVMMRNVNKKSNFLQNIVEYCVFGIAKVAKPGDPDVFLRWKKTSYINSKEPFPANTNCMVHFPSAEERKFLMKGVGENATPWRPQEKPLNLIRELVKRFSPPNSLIVDLFAGTFTTAMAAHKQGREFVGCEIDEELFKAAVERVQRFCTQESVSEENGTEEKANEEKATEEKATEENATEENATTGSASSDPDIPQ